MPSPAAIPFTLLAVLSLILALAIILRDRAVAVRGVPGPFWARWTNLARFWWVVGGRAHEIHISLHEKHGRLVRMGPSMVSVADPAEIRTIYGITERWRKVGGAKPPLSESVG